MIDVINALEESLFASSDWYFLGLQLRIKNNDLKTIKSDYRDNRRCLANCLIKWLITGKATYTGLAEALWEMGQNATADYFNSKCVCIFILYVTLEFQFKVVRL